MKKARQLHLWIGLFCSVIILVEAITGLLLSEPWLMGMEGKREMRAPQTVAATEGFAGDDRAASGAENGRPMMRGAQGANGLMGIVHQLHEGRIGGMDLTWLADLSAIAMIILTSTGIYLSIQTLRAQRIRRQRGA
ncbi:PepSY domain-containing protein [Brevibacillus sp. SYP-B805]|uniref:PepSY-associated TM helix domain-containing protein n=1 Tax=Brevibacillus sp. SYP-B805 TaxID=1578199 RepID=UPI0013EA7476|nr:PepSY-associated TM helix domain-containing protein [Brevibacillus sp. SYP-B805]NGQ94925.1 PepSY domain-containing protein [Brevibacillus sp. SYP-B805]